MEISSQQYGHEKKYSIVRVRSELHFTDLDRRYDIRELGDIPLDFRSMRHKGRLERLHRLEAETRHHLIGRLAA